MASEPNAKDIDRLNLPGEFFELLDQTGHVLQQSMNLAAPMKLNGLNVAGSQPTFGIAALENGETVRVSLIPFQQGNQSQVFAVAIPTFWTNRVLDSFARVALLLFPLSLLLTAGTSPLSLRTPLPPTN